MSAQSLSAVGIEAQDKLVAPNYIFVASAFIALAIFNFIIISGFVFLAHSNAALTKGQTGDSIVNIYYDEVKKQEEKDNKDDGCMAKFKTAPGEEKKDSEEEENKAPDKPEDKGPTYPDLVNLLDDFKQQYKVLQKQL